MEKPNLQKVIELLVAAYPERGINAKTVEVYARCLSDLPVMALQAAVLAHIASNKWFPTVSELRQAAIDVMPGNRIPTATEAWAEVMKNFEHPGSYGDPSFSHPAIAKTVQAMGWRNLCLSEDGMADRAHFIRLYESYATRLRQEQVMLPEVHRIEQQLARGGPHKELPNVVRSLVEAKRVNDEKSQAD